jgi:endopolyphosphatase
LINATFKWIEEHLKDEIDFVVWTGDSAKHDNDDRIPRTETQVIEQNRLVVEKFAEVFGEGKHHNKGFSIPIVPTLGNNDVLPHNIFKEGPNKWTKEYLDIWKAFIPQDQKEEFKNGGYFSVEVIPNHLAVISLNTLHVILLPVGEARTNVGLQLLL